MKAWARLPRCLDSVKENVREVDGYEAASPSAVKDRINESNLLYLLSSLWIRILTSLW